MAKRLVCTVLVAVGLVGCWFATIDHLRTLSVWRHHIHDGRLEAGPRTIPKEKLETLSKEDLVMLVDAGERVLAAEDRFSLAGYRDLLATSAIGLISTVIVTFGLLCSVFLQSLLWWRKPRP